MTSSGATTQNKRRGKTVIKEVEQINRRYVTFSKRKLGLFNKLTELSILCNVETALIITSQNGKLYSCGYPDADVVIRRYLTGGRPQKHNCGNKKEVEKMRMQYESVQNQLKEEQRHLQEIKETQNGSFLFLDPWWNASTDDMGLESLDEFKTSLELLKYNLVGALQEKNMNSIPSILPSTMVSPTLSSTTVSTMSPANLITPIPRTIVPVSQLPLLTQYFSGNQVQDYPRSAIGTTSILSSNSFGHGNQNLRQTNS